MSAFVDQFSARAVALDVNFGESLEVRHVGAGQFLAAAADPAQPPFDAIGILDMTVEVRDDRGQRTAARSEVVAPAPQVDFAATQFGPGRPAPTPGTILVALTRLNTPSFRVLDVLPGDDGRVVCQLAKL